MVLNAMGPVDLIFGFILTEFGAADSGVSGRHPALLPILRDLEQMGFNTGGFTACAVRL